MVSLSVAHAHCTTHRALTLREPSHLNGGSHNNCIAPFTSKEHVLLLIVFIQNLVASPGTENASEQ